MLSLASLQAVSTISIPITSLASVARQIPIVPIPEQISKNTVFSFRSPVSFPMSLYNFSHCGVCTCKKALAEISNVFPVLENKLIN